jgi:endonuclease/exonuclease/phosphatase family metal-dependent hydrolase
LSRLRGAYAFEEFPRDAREQGAAREWLCPGTQPDKVRINCRIEGGSFTPAGVAPKDEIVVMSYNVERGLKMEEQIARLLDPVDLPPPDVILVSEADRGCSRTGSRNVMREMAEALAMNYVYGVEFIELPRWWGKGKRIDAPCEHGNGILSRYPLGNVELIRHRTNRSWYGCLQRLFRLGEPRMGGRMALAADVKVGGRYLHLYSVHFESGSTNGRFRDDQALELAEDAEGKPHGVIIGGDMNTSEYLGDLRDGAEREGATRAFRRAGYTDAHAGLPADGRITTPSGVVIDLLFGKGVAFKDAGIGTPEQWGGLSDHYPVWARVRL